MAQESEFPYMVIPHLPSPNSGSVADHHFLQQMNILLEYSSGARRISRAAGPGLHTGHIFVIRGPVQVLFYL